MEGTSHLEAAELVEHVDSRYKSYQVLGKRVSRGVTSTLMDLDLFLRRRA